MTSAAICIPTFNQCKYLEASARSAFAQSVPGTLVEVWLSDDASTDETPRVVADIQREFPALKAVRQEKNLGMSGNPRWVVSQPKTDFILKLDSDDVLCPDYIAKLLPLMEAHPRAGYAHCAVLEIGDDDATRRARRLGRDTGFQSADESLHALASGYRVAANICLFRRAALEEVDFYKTDMRFADDWDMAVRLADKGWGNVYHSDVLALYRVWDDAGQTRARRKMDEIQGCARVYSESLAPAFKRRNWSIALLEREQRSWALHHSIVLLSPAFSEAERTNLRRALREFGPSTALECRFALYRLGLGPLVRARDSLGLRLRDLAKSALQLLKYLQARRKSRVQEKAKGVTGAGAR